MRVHLQYGREGLDVELPSTNVRLIEPRRSSKVWSTKRAGFRRGGPRAHRHAPARRDRAGRRARRDRHSRHHPPAAHRSAAALAVRRTGARARRKHHHHQRHRLAPREHAGRAGRDGRCGRALSRYRVVNHDAHDPARRLRSAGKTTDGAHRTTRGTTSRPIGASRWASSSRTSWRAFRADTRASSRPSPTSTRSCTTTARTVIGHPRSTWGVLDGNPTQEQIRTTVRCCRSIFWSTSR